MEEKGKNPDSHGMFWNYLDCVFVSKGKKLQCRTAHGKQTGFL